MGKTSVVDSIKEIFFKAGLDGKDLKSTLREAVAAVWPSLPPWSTLSAPIIEEVQKTNIGCCALLTFTEDGVRKVVIGVSGPHYKGHDPDQPRYVMPGGFANLSSTEGSTFVPQSDHPENARVTAARETEEEFVLPNGEPLLPIDPARLMPLDTDTLAFPNGEKLTVIGLMMELNDSEVSKIKSHVEKLNTDAVHKKAAMEQTLNPGSNLAEISDITILRLDDLAGKKYPLLHADQQSLFERAQEYFAGIESAVLKRLQTFNTQTYPGQIPPSSQP
jgi:hypothetical protein